MYCETVAKQPANAVRDSSLHCAPRVDVFNQNCGGFWEVNVYRIRADVAVAVDEASWSFAIILIVIGLGYLFGGILFGMRASGERKPSLQRHLHYAHWVQIYGLCQDGWAFSRARAGMRREQPVLRQTREPLLDGEESSLSKRGSKSKLSGSKSKSASKKSSSGRSDKEQQKRRVGKDKRREKQARGEKLTKQEEAEEKEEIAQEEKERQLRELSDSTGVHSSQAKIKVIGING